MRVALVSCVKMKAREPRAAKDLYVSPLFRGLRTYAEANADAWYILSAEHGLLSPHAIVAPYERTLLHMRKSERQEWANRVIASLQTIIEVNDEIMVLAGERYREHLIPWLKLQGLPFTVPLLGLKMGEQLQRLAFLNRPTSDGHA